MQSLSALRPASGGIRFGAVNPAQLLQKLHETMTINGPTTKQAGVTHTKVSFNGNPYDVTVKQDGTFTATNNAGITIRLFHDKSVWGSPMTFSYTNDRNPSQNVTARDPESISKARELGRKIATQSDSGNGFEL